MHLPTNKNVKTITDLREDALGVLKDLKKEDLLYIFHRSEPQGIMLSNDQYARLIERIEDLEDELFAQKAHEETLNTPEEELIPLDQILKEFDLSRDGIAKQDL